MIILASKSPRRKELLKYIIEDFEIKSADVDETLPTGIEPKEAVKYLSKIKADPFRSENDIIIGADTVVCIDNEILGKPADVEDAKRMLKRLSGKTHTVYTGVTIIKGEQEKSFAEATEVTFHNLDDEIIDKYIATGSPMDKAGAYGIQDFGAVLVEKINGDYFNVVGLPISSLYRILTLFS